MPASNKRASGIAPTTGTAGPQQQAAGLVARVLSNPAIFPDEFKAWLPRWIMQNINFSVSKQQLPQTENDKLVGATGNAAFTSSWTNFSGTYEPAKYYKDNFNLVHLGGVISGGTIPASAWTLPAGYRPQAIMIFPVVSNGLFGIVTVNPDGTVVISAGNNAYVSLSGIVFRQFS